MSEDARPTASVGAQQGSWGGTGQGSPLTSCRSGENEIMMSKVYIFLIFMVLILPSLGLTRYASSPPALSSQSGPGRLRPQVVLEDADP